MFPNLQQHYGHHGPDVLQGGRPVGLGGRHGVGELGGVVITPPVVDPCDWQTAATKGTWQTGAAGAWAIAAAQGAWTTAASGDWADPASAGGFRTRKDCDGC